MILVKYALCALLVGGGLGEVGLGGYVLRRKVGRERENGKVDRWGMDQAAEAEAVSYERNATTVLKESVQGGTQRTCTVRTTLLYLLGCVCCIKEIFSSRE